MILIELITENNRPLKSALDRNAKLSPERIIDRNKDGGKKESQILNER